MSDWGIALIAAGSALAGSVVTGWYARIAGGEQARAARHAGDRQADAMLETVRLSQRAQAAERSLDVRRQAYVRFLHAAETVAVAARGESHPDARATLQRALAEIDLEGPAAVSTTARAYADLLRRRARPEEAAEAKQSFLAAARSALLPPG